MNRKGADLEDIQSNLVLLTVTVKLMEEKFRKLFIYIEPILIFKYQYISILRHINIKTYKYKTFKYLY